MPSSDNQQVWPAPAKLNLMLRITGRRKDGYHELQTVFQFIDLADKLHFSVRKDSKLICNPPLKDVPDKHNLCLRAAHLLQTATNCKLGAYIHLKKHLPLGGGLGGGSSDAATTLLALNQLWDTRLSKQQLAQLGLQLGADIPIFIHGRAAWAEGIGEQLAPIEIPTPWYLVIQPSIHISTADIFSDSDLTRDAKPITIRDFLAGETVNDCLPVVKKRYPEVVKALNWLNNHADARLTGTGACIFAEFESRQEAEQILSQMPDKYAGFVAKGLNQSPVMDCLSD